MNIDAGSRNLTVAFALTLSGGFLDAFAYVGHGHVFANTMTGNVALLGMNIAAADWSQAWRHVPPLIAFVLAVLVMHLMRLRGPSRWIRQPELTCLLLEIGFIAVAASDVLRINDAWLIPGISFVATLQTLSFTHVEDLAYTSVMTTGNLRRFTQRLLAGLIPHHNALALHDARVLGTISLGFLLGAIMGGYATSHLGNGALWLSAMLLVIALCGIFFVAVRHNAISDVVTD